MKKTLIVLVALMAIGLAACNNKRAERPASLDPRTWGDQTLAVSLEKGCVGGALTTVIDGSTYPCPDVDGAVGEPGQQGEAIDGSQSARLPLAAGDSLMTVCDFTTASAKEATGVDVQRIGTEACGFVWRGVNLASETANCPANMVCTFHLTDDRKVVVQGDGSSYEIVAGTFRVASAYPLEDAVRDVCRLLAKEQAFGASEVPSFEVTAGNFACP